VVNQDIHFRPKIILSILYCNVTSSQLLIMNVKGQITNVLPLVEARAKKSWICNALCKVDDPILVDRYKKFLQAISLLLRKYQNCYKRFIHV